MAMNHQDVTPAARAAFDRVNIDNWTTLAVKPDKRPLDDWGAQGDPNRFDYRNSEDIFARFMNEQDFKRVVADWVARAVYGRLRRSSGGGEPPISPRD